MNPSDITVTKKSTSGLKFVNFILSCVIVYFYSQRNTDNLPDMIYDETVEVVYEAIDDTNYDMMDLLQYNE